MKENRKWAQNFNIEKNLSLKEALNHFISEEDYLEWACKEYQLPLLCTDYFKTHPSLELWNKFKGTMSWDSTLVPLEEWEDCLYVGCLEPQCYPLKQKVVFVLAPLKKLESVWSYYSSKENSQDFLLNQNVGSVIKSHKKPSSSKKNLDFDEEDLTIQMKKDGESSKSSHQKVQESVQNKDSSKKNLELSEEVELLQINKSGESSGDSHQKTQESAQNKDSSEKKLDSSENVLVLQINKSGESSEDSHQKTQESAQNKDSSEKKLDSDKNVLILQINKSGESSEDSHQKTQESAQNKDSSKKNMELSEEVKPLQMKKDGDQVHKSSEKKTQESVQDKNFQEQESGEKLKVQNISKDLDFQEKSSPEKNSQKEINQNLEKARISKQTANSSNEIIFDEISYSLWNRVLGFLTRFLFSKSKKSKKPQKSLKKEKIRKIKLSKVDQKKLEQKKMDQKKMLLKKTEAPLESQKKIQTEIKNSTKRDSLKIDKIYPEEAESSVQISFKKDQLKPHIRFQKSQDDSKQKDEVQKPIQFNSIDTQTKVEVQKPIQFNSIDTQTKVEVQKPTQFNSIDTQTKVQVQKPIQFNSIHTQTKVCVEKIQSPVRSILEKSKKYASSYILFRFSNGKFVPVKWSHDLSPQKTQAVSVKQASFLRVAYYSKQSYFGFIPPVLGNQNFFENWNFESLPDQIVFIPFVNKDKKEIYGGYLGILNEPNSSLECLHSIEKIINPLVEHYQSKKSIKKLAA